MGKLIGEVLMENVLVTIMHVLRVEKKYQNDLESTEKVFLLTMDIYESAGTDSVVRCR